MTSANPTSWQLGHTDGVPIQSLSNTAGDTDLEVVLADADTSKVVVGILDRLPTRQWRLVRDVDVPHGRATRKEVWVAPAGSDTWWLLTATHVDGARHILVDPVPRVPLPSREDRRSGLELDWVSSAVTVTASAATQHEFAFVLRNTSENDWVNVAGDTRSITIVTNVEPRFYVDTGDDRPLPALPAYGATTIHGGLSEPLPIGTYEASAILVNLNLVTTSTATLTVVAD